MPGSYQVPFNRPSFVGHELDYIRQAMERMHISGDGPFTARAHELLRQATGAPHALLTTSCTHALELAAILLDLGPGDEVIVPSFTFTSTANAFALRGATPVFVDVRRDTFNLDERLVEAAVTPRTRAIVPVHYAGVGCEMDALQAIADRHGLRIVEDNAHGLFGSWRGRRLGTFGCLATQSFHETKNISCGEGGALLLNDPRLLERAEILREKGTDRSRFFRGEVDKYTWVDIGSSYLPSDLLAAVLCAQLERREVVQARRRQLWLGYATALRDWASDHRVRLPVVPPHCEQPFHLFSLLLPTPGARDALIEHLRARAVNAVFHYQPLHLSAMGRRFGARPGACPVAEDVAGRLLRLPLFFAMTPAQHELVVTAVREFTVAATAAGSERAP
ncbi:MAG: dTDP-4-amino-4,6-dideoxygalactose transaminase [Planctomycetota bacterium]